MMTQDALALEGGPPVRTAPFPAWPISDQREEHLLLEVLHSGKWSVFTGDKVKTFQERFARYQQARYALCVPSGTLALELALLSLDLTPGDEVIVPAYTFIATVSSALRLGLRPVFVDIHPDTYTLDPALIPAAITPKTKAILPVHLAGQPADMDAMRSIAAHYSLHVIEDACQAWGAEWQGQRVGALGALGAFSFQNSKNITAGEGGALLTNNTGLYERAWSLHNVGRTRSGAWYHHELLGSNLRMTEWQGAILLAQLERLEEQYPRRERNARFLEQALAQIGGLVPLPEDGRVTRHARHLVILRYDSAAFGGHPLDQFLQALHAEGVTPVSRGYVPLHQAPAIRKTMQALFSRDPAQASLPASERAAGQTIFLAQNALLGDEEDLQDIAVAVAKIRRAWRRPACR
jgi:dTDP-4-amino-4,6-dideoxygalactose transaminase